MYINREYTFDYFLSNIYNDSYIIITSNISNIRSAKLLTKLSGCKYINVSYNLSMNDDNTLNDKFNIDVNFDNTFDLKEFSSLELGLNSFVKQLNKQSKNIIIDISSFHLRFLGAFIAIINNFKWESILCTYTEPTAYPRSKETIPSNSEKKELIGGFDLNSSFWGYEEIPNLKTISSEQSNFVWIVFLGFEGKRADSVYTEISDDVNNIIPVITFPSIRPGWANFAYDANQILFEKARIISSDIKYTDATSPFEAYNCIEKIKSNHENQHIVISPLGTRPVSLGAILYAMKHAEAEIYYDTPKESCSNIVNGGKIHVYDILSFFNNNGGSLNVY